MSDTCDKAQQQKQQHPYFHIHIFRTGRDDVNAKVGMDAGGVARVQNKLGTELQPRLDQVSLALVVPSYNIVILVFLTKPERLEAPSTRPFLLRGPCDASCCCRFSRIRSCGRC